MNTAKEMIALESHVTLANKLRGRAESIEKSAEYMKKRARVAREVESYLAAAYTMAKENVDDIILGKKPHHDMKELQAMLVGPPFASGLNDYGIYNDESPVWYAERLAILQGRK